MNVITIMLIFVVKCPSIGGNLLANTYRDKGGGRKCKQRLRAPIPAKSCNPLQDFSFYKHRQITGVFLLSGRPFGKN